MGPALAVPANGVSGAAGCSAAGCSGTGVVLHSGWVVAGAAGAAGVAAHQTGQARRVEDAVKIDPAGFQRPRIADGRVIEIRYSPGQWPSKETQHIRNRIYQAVRILSEDIPALTFKEMATAMSKTKANLRIGFQSGGCWSYVGLVGRPQGGKHMNLDKDWDGGQGPPVGTILHEFLHFLGVEHEHQRDDAHPYVFVDSKALKANGTNLAQNADIHPFRYDSASIMHYPSGTGFGPTSAQWAKIGQRIQLSQLDKLFVNMLYPPVAGNNGYYPAKGKTGLWYCGRNVMNNNNFPFGRVGCDGRCGPNDGPNCPSCIIYGISQGNEYPLRRGGAFQTGETGLFYCGKRFTRTTCSTVSGHQCSSHDGVCGPNNGPCCESCMSLLQA